VTWQTLFDRASEYAVTEADVQAALSEVRDE